LEEIDMVLELVIENNEVRIKILKIMIEYEEDIMKYTLIGIFMGIHLSMDLIHRWEIEK